MMKKILCLALALMLCAVIPAAAEDVQPVTAEEMGARLESVRTEMQAAQPLNDPSDAEAQNEDGTLFRYETVRIYADGTELAPDTPVNALVFEDSEGPVFRGLGIDSTQDEVLAAFPNDNPELAGTREEALLFLRNTEAGGFVYGRILRDGQRVTAVEYGEVLPAGERFRCIAVTFTLQDQLVVSIRADGLNPEDGLIDATYANEFYTELNSLSGQDAYKAVKTSRNGLELTAFDESDLAFSGFSFTELQPDTLPDIMEQEQFDNEDGTWLLRCEGAGYEAVFRCDGNGENAKILSFSILDDQLEGPRGVRLGDQFSEDFCRFRSGEHEMSEDLTELLYGTEGTAPWGYADYNPEDMSLRYVTVTQDGAEVELILRFVENYLTEIMLQTV